MLTFGTKDFKAKIGTMSVLEKILNMQNAETKREWERELEKVGLTQELLDYILAASPEREIVPGYPQDRVERIIVQQNW